MLVATCSGSVISGHQQVDLASAGNWPDLVVCLCLLFLCFLSFFVVSLFGWIVILLMMVDGGIR